MDELKCPWQTVETVTTNVDGECTKTVLFADCVGDFCPFWRYEEIRDWGKTIIPAGCARDGRDRRG